jgi:gamma-glutamyltranspeptidase/glutathione hydrolase
MSTGHYPPHEAVAGVRGVVASAHPYATEAALRVLDAGGTAVDAAIAAGAVLTVVMPWAGQVGGDCFFLVADPDGTVSAVNGSGAAPLATSLAAYQERGEVPDSGWWSTTVPGMVDGWRTAHERWGRAGWGCLFDAAVRYAGEGIVTTSTWISRVNANAKQWSQFEETARIFLPNGEPPAVGSVFRQPDLAGSLRAIATDGPDALYRGELARKIVAASEAAGGLFSEADLDNHHTPTPPPLTMTYQGATLYEQPPVTQGIVLFMALGTLEHAGYSNYPAAGTDSVHLQIEATKLGFIDRLANLGDPDVVDVPVDLLLSDEAHARRAGAINMQQQRDQFAKLTAHADTTSLVVADADGRVVTYIHSLYTGSGVVVPGTGIMMNSRALGFSLDPDSPNVIAPGKRPVHTLNAVMARRGDEIFGICTPGANLQVQHNLQVLSNLIDHGMELQEAVDAPRWSMGDQLSIGDPALEIEDRFGDEVLAGLEQRGHTINRKPGWAVGGGIQAVRRDQTHGTLWAARDPRRGGNLASAI